MTSKFFWPVGVQSVKSEMFWQKYLELPLQLACADIFAEPRPLYVDSVFIKGTVVNKL